MTLPYAICFLIKIKLLQTDDSLNSANITNAEMINFAVSVFELDIPSIAEFLAANKSEN